MGFLTPKIKVPAEDPALVAARRREEARAKRDRVRLLSEELDTDTRLRLRRFGSQGGLSGGSGGGSGVTIGGTASTTGVSSPLALALSAGGRPIFGF